MFDFFEFFWSEFREDPVTHTVIRISSDSDFDPRKHI